MRAVNCANSCFSHCYISVDPSKGNITPIIKNVKGNAADFFNYCIGQLWYHLMLKILELHILDILKESVFCNFRQFGFRKGMSPSDTCFMLKETLRLYTEKGKQAFVAFMNL